MEKWIKQEEIHKGKIFSLWGGQVVLDNGEVAVREYIRHSGGVGIVPVIDGNVILIRQFRISIERELIELPAGRLEPNEDPMNCAARELEEEIGYRANKSNSNCFLFCVCGKLKRENVFVFGARPRKNRKAFGSR